MSNNTHTVAVYGSLKNGRYNNHVLGKKAKFVGTSTINGMVVSESNTLIPLKYGALHLEVYELNDAAYKRVQMLEIPNGWLEQRFKIPVLVDVKTSEYKYMKVSIFVRMHDTARGGDTV